MNQPSAPPCSSFVLALLSLLMEAVCGRRHPLFPLLALLFEKCEQSTLSSDCITSASFDVDIENFVRCQEKEGNPFFSEDPELDNLVSFCSIRFKCRPMALTSDSTVDLQLCPGGRHGYP